MYESDIEMIAGPSLRWSFHLSGLTFADQLEEDNEDDLDDDLDSPKAPEQDSETGPFDRQDEGGF